MFKEESAGLTFVHPIRVYYEDTDAAGVVYYANYLKFIERARTEWLRSRGLELREIELRDGVVFAVRAVDARYVKPSGLSDILDVVTTLVQFGKASLELDQNIYRENELLFKSRVKLACVDRQSFKPKPIPDPVRNEFNQWKTQ